jgi:hypothetical protein
MITQERLKQLLTYDPDTGMFTRRTYVRGHKVGEPVGFNWNGYWGIKVDGKGYQAHRLAWLYMYGEHPKQQIDHINRNKMDNRISNLRDVNRSRNRENQAAPYKNNKLGMQGVSMYRSKYKAQIQIKGVVTYLGVYETADEAQQAYKNAKCKHHIKENDHE